MSAHIPQDTGSREHVAILNAMRAIETDLDRFSDEPPSREVVRALGFAITALRKRMRDHFRREEAHGLLSGVHSLDPETRAVVDELRRQHGEFESRLNKSIDDVGGAEGLAGVVPEALIHELRGLFKDIRKHEAREELLEREGD